MLAQCLLSVLALTGLTLVCVRLQIHFAASLCLYLILVVLVSRAGSLLSSVVVSVLATACLDYYFLPPLYSFQIGDPLDALSLVAFLSAAAVVAGLASRLHQARREAYADIESRRQVEEALRRSEAYLAHAQGLSHTGSFGWCVSSGEIFWSAETFRIFQFSPTEKPTLQRVVARVHPEDRPSVQQTIERATREGRDFEHHYRLQMPDGSVKYLHVVALAQRDAAGEIEFVGAVMDRTAAKQAEQKLRQSEAYLAEAQRLSHTGSWAWTPATGEIRYWSEECFRLLGFDPRDEPPRIDTVYERIHPEDLPRVRETFERGIREKEMYEYDYRIVHPNGAIREIHLVGHPVLSPTGELMEAVGSVIDVTERKRAERERERLRQVQADLARVSRMTTMGELTASLAHEVSQPIAAAVANASACQRWLIRDVPQLEEARAAAARMLQDGMRAGQIIKRIRLLFEKGPELHELVDLNEVIREMIALLHFEAVQHSIAVRATLEDNLPRVLGDHLQLQQVLMNLMLNGIDAMKGATARELIIRSQRLVKDEVTVSISDTGVGLRADETAQIFEPFFTTKLHGMGMGLSISRSIVEAHGGRLWAAANAPCGVSFCLSLPAHDHAGR